MTRVQIVNDRGIAICKSMLAWEMDGAEATPSTTGKKGDHLVGEYYVRFEADFKREYAAWQATDQGRETIAAVQVKDGERILGKAYKNTYFNEHSALGRRARKMLLAWEAGDPAVRALWAKMNGWVYDGFRRDVRAARGDLRRALLRVGNLPSRQGDGGGRTGARGLLPEARWQRLGRPHRTEARPQDRLARRRYVRVP